jgi:hypothetical protein
MYAINNNDSYYVEVSAVLKNINNGNTYPPITKRFLKSTSIFEIHKHFSFHNHIVSKVTTRKIFVNKSVIRHVKYSTAA